MKFKIWLLTWAFNHLFKDYQTVFDSMNDKILNMNDGQRMEHFILARSAMENATLIKEFEEAMRHFYKELALKSKNDMERYAYRLTIKFIRDFRRRLQELAAASNGKKLSTPTHLHRL